ncbi:MULTISPECIES: DNA-3-methyladenine glycosylase I [unclassified Ruegeria]|uniref:DNA-3-methyladenine glycosylase I n=1 Tax=unclassified Ruegeria TaxID=2625375 RepID=UPI001AD9AB30|nr:MULTISPECIES: DNA-3-methyladenine glycosylase I [unclassified Ruegeria]MBO9411247.1 DNA-3-methyladenine glycosylase I [Ruegeria sp. R8_1]MBO9415448.1 DNA-3-methyladenine glycosylase I [Ruegeria sp. R8_2]
MHHFDDIFRMAADRHGGADALNSQLETPKSPEELADLPEDRWLSVMTKCIFQAGFSWKVIESKWDGFEAAFDGFDVGRCAFMDDEKFDSLLQDTRIVRNGTKIAAVRDNAAFLLELREEGGAGRVLGGWPSTDFVGLLEMLRKRGARLGGTSAQIAMRFAGRDSFILSQDVTARLIAEGVVDKAPTSKKAMKAVQAAFNTWMDQSGRSLTEISRVLAMSV